MAIGPDYDSNGIWLAGNSAGAGLERNSGVQKRALQGQFEFVGELVFSERSFRHGKITGAGARFQVPAIHLDGNFAILPVERLVGRVVGQGVIVCFFVHAASHFRVHVVAAPERFATGFAGKLLQHHISEIEFRIVGQIFRAGVEGLRRHITGIRDQAARVHGVDGQARVQEIQR